MEDMQVDEFGLNGRMDYRFPLESSSVLPAQVSS